jgi:hypothetical protein
VPLNAANSAEVRQLYQPLRLSPTYHQADQTVDVKVDPMADCVENRDRWSGAQRIWDQRLGFIRGQGTVQQ